VTPNQEKRSRIDLTFEKLAEEKRAALVTYFMAGDPDMETSQELLNAMPRSGADIIELGMPFTDPMADGPSIQRAGNRALRAGQTMAKTFEIVRSFRQGNDTTPIILMGYYNPIYSYGVDAWIKDAKAAGVDGMIIVDLPAEEDAELCIPAVREGLAFIRLVAPTTTEARLATVLNNTSGFVYYVSVTGITGGRTAGEDELRPAIARLRARTGLPLAVGFGIKTRDHAASVARLADASVVGTSIVDALAACLGEDDKPKTGADVTKEVTALVRDLAQGVRGARKLD
jgi:tryptophan synthase alpha chain